MISLLSESRILAPAFVPFVGALLLQIIFRRLFRQPSTRGIMTGALCIGAAACVAWLLAKCDCGTDQAADALAALALYAGLAYAHADLYGFHRGAIRLQALRYIHRHGGAAKKEELHSVCGIEKTVDHRIAQYLRRGEISLVDGRYRLARNRVLFITKTFRFIRRLIMGSRPRSV